MPSPICEKAIRHFFHERGLQTMSVYKLIEVVGTSNQSFAEATRAAVEGAAKPEAGAGWFEVTEMRGQLKEGKVTEFQVKVKIGLRMEG